MMNVFGLGDVHDKFTIQSTSKPITYALTLEELGTDAERLHRRVALAEQLFDGAEWRAPDRFLGVDPRRR